MGQPQGSPCQRRVGTEGLARVPRPRRQARGTLSARIASTDRRGRGAHGARLPWTGGPSASTNWQAGPAQGTSPKGRCEGAVRGLGHKGFGGKQGPRPPAVRPP